MKKIYQNPEIRIVNVQTTQMIAVSIQTYGKDAEGTAMSRHGGRSFFDDDEED